MASEDSKKAAAKTEKFVWVGNEPALDFVNTAIVSQGRPVDLLAERHDLVRWLHEAGLLRVPKSTPRPLLDAALHAARDYRRLLRFGVQTLMDTGGLPRDTVAATNALLARKAARDLLVPDGRRFALERRWDLNSPEDVCAPIALSFARFIAMADLERVRRCKNPECVLVFYDVSKSGTRSWCSLNTCGNKLRVAAFRKRLAGG
ncbi:MAG TPA: CGNR zinc finger domain-containing protein [Candidatus Limnocylindrales bacterium]|nr:CGNR zinc finger domain-containing protein [Candidatus Limnocylindrales bacterium]